MTETSTDKNKRIAKNTLLLYIRTFVTMIISLFTSRLILDALGVDNFGIYNVVGGFVGMFSIISGSLSSSISRYLTYGLGKGDVKHLKMLFSTSVNVQLFLSVIIILLGETIGLWFLTTHLNIPSDRMYAAHWVLQCSIFSFVLNLISTPYNACIIAHERMNVFAYMTILDVVLKLLSVYTLFIAPFDTLITYSVSLVLINALMRFIYGTYCNRNFKECKYELVFDCKVLKEMTGFAWWSFLGNTAYIFNTQGVNMAINIFFGVVYNAARGIVGQVENAVMSLVGNFTTAFSPQITKSYAEGNKDYMFSLICRGSKFSFFLFLLILLPLEYEAPTILSLWLKEVPSQSVLFLRISLLCSAVMLLGGPSYTAVMATGNIKKYQIVITIVGCLVFPLTVLAYRAGASVQTTYYIYFLIYSILIYIRLAFMKKLLGFQPVRFLNTVVMPVMVVSTVSLIMPTIVSAVLAESLFRFVVLTILTVFSTSLAIYVLGFTSSERLLITNKIRPILVRIGL